MLDPSLSLQTQPVQIQAADPSKSLLSYAALREALAKGDLMDLQGAGLRLDLGRSVQLQRALQQLAQPDSAQAPAATPPAQATGVPPPAPGQGPYVQGPQGPSVVTPGEGTTYSRAPEAQGQAASAPQNPLARQESIMQQILASGHKDAPAIVASLREWQKGGLEIQGKVQELEGKKLDIQNQLLSSVADAKPEDQATVYAHALPLIQHLVPELAGKLPPTYDRQAQQAVTAARAMVNTQQQRAEQAVKATEAQAKLLEQRLKAGEVTNVPTLGGVQPAYTHLDPTTNRPFGAPGSAGAPAPVADPQSGQPAVSLEAVKAQQEAATQLGNQHNTLAGPYREATQAYGVIQQSKQPEGEQNVSDVSLMGAILKLSNPATPRDIADARAAELAKKGTLKEELARLIGAKLSDGGTLNQTDRDRIAQHADKLYGEQTAYYQQKIRDPLRSQAQRLHLDPETVIPDFGRPGYQLPSPGAPGNPATPGRQSSTAPGSTLSTKQPVSSAQIDAMVAALQAKGRPVTREQVIQQFRNEGYTVQ